MTKVMDHAGYQLGLRTKTVEELRYIIRDAQEAIAANPSGHNAGYYADEVCYAAAEIRRARAFGVQVVKVGRSWLVETFLVSKDDREVGVISRCKPEAGERVAWNAYRGVGAGQTFLGNCYGRDAAIALVVSENLVGT